MKKIFSTIAACVVATMTMSCGNVCGAADKDVKFDSLSYIVGMDVANQIEKGIMPQLKADYAVIVETIEKIMDGKKEVKVADVTISKESIQEIGMKYLDVPTKEGGYFRTGARTPMQWDGSANLGFSEGEASDLYLPVDSSEDAPTVAAQEKDPASLLNTVRAILTLRHQEEDLQADADFKVVCSEAGKPFVYRRGDLLCAVNPAGSEQSVTLPASAAAKLEGSVLFELGRTSLDNGVLTVGAQSFVVIK